MLINKNAALILITLAIALGSVVPSAQAQATEITNVNYPSSLLYDVETGATDPPAVVTATVSYTGAAAGSYLQVGVFQLDDGSLAGGSTTSAPEQCVQNVTASYAACIMPLKYTSGSGDFNFVLRSRPKRFWNLAIVAMLANSSLSTIYESESDYTFTITVYTALGLRITVPDSVTVIVDGRNRSQGSIRLSLIAGYHNVSVPDTIQLSNDTRIRFMKWSDGSTQANRTALLNHSLDLEANYVTQYLLVVESPLSVSGAGWYDQGTNATISANSTFPMNGLLGILGGRWVFQGWYGNGQMLASSSSASLQMNHPLSVTARWSPDYLIPLILLAAFALLVSFSLIYVRRTRTKRKRRRLKRSRRRQRATTKS